MNNRWKTYLKNAGWLMFTAGGIALLVAAVQKKNLKNCTDIKVELTGLNSHVFMDEQEILNVLGSNGALVGQPIESINLQVLESRLEKDKWIKNAELFFDNNQVLNVSVEERIPVARIFTIAGNSYYIDSSAMQLPLSGVSVRVPMFTTFPAVGRLAKQDSALMNSIKELAIYINGDEFWNAQVSQIDITPQRTLELIPTVGNHVVKLGKGTDLKEKFDRLYSFYKQVWVKVGLEKYALVDVQFKNQVIATRKGAWTINTDSTAVKQAIDAMMTSTQPGSIHDSLAPKKQVVKKESGAANGGKKTTIAPAAPKENKPATAKQNDKVKVPKAVMVKQK